MQFKKHKILILGSVQPNFMNQLYTNLPNFDFDNLEIHILLGNDEYKNNNYFFKHKHISTNVETSFFERIKYTFKVLKKTSISELFLDIRVRGVKKIQSILKERIDAFALVEKVIIREEYDLIQLYYCYRNHIITYLPAKQNLLVSVWGSDLFRYSGVYNYYYQSKIFDRANNISIHSVEMKEVLLAKYGRHLFDKIQIALFPQDVKLYQEINKISEVEINDFKGKYKIPRDKVVIAIGHNAKRENNQIKVVNEIAKLDKSLKDKIVCIFPLNYSNNNKEEFATELNEICKQNGILSVTFTNFFDIKKQPIEFAAFRKIQDIVVHLLISDALSHYVTEAMYAGNILITGAWLPYGTFRRAGLDFKEIESIENLYPLLEKILSEGVEKYKPNIKKQQKAIEQKFFPEPTSKMWIELYSKILNN